MQISFCCSANECGQASRDLLAAEACAKDYTSIPNIAIVNIYMQRYSNCTRIVSFAMQGAIVTRERFKKKKEVTEPISKSVALWELPLNFTP